MKILALLVKICLFWIVASWIFRRVWRRLQRQWYPHSQRRWRREWAYATAFLSIMLSSWVLSAALDLIPKLGKWFRLAPSVLDYFDAAHPLKSVAGFVIAWGSVTLLCSILQFILFARVFDVQQNVVLPRVFCWTVGYSVLISVQDWVFRRLGLPDPHESNFADLWTKVAVRATATHSQNWQGPLQAAGCFLSLAGLGLLGHLMWKSGRRIELNYWDRFDRRGRRTFLLSASLILTAAWWHFGFRVAARWKLAPAGPTVTPSSAWMVWYGISIVFVLLVVFSARYLGGQRLSFDAIGGGRTTMVAAGLLWSFMAAASAAAVAAYSHHWSPSLAHALSSSTLLRYALVLAEQSVAASILLHAYVLANTASLYGYSAGLAVSAAGYCVLFAHPGLTWGEAALLCLVGVFIGYLYWVTQGLWAPIAFQFGWWFALGPLLGFTIAPLRAPGSGDTPIRTFWLQNGAPHLEGVPEMLIIVFFSIVAVWLLQPKWRTAPIGGSN